MKTIIRNLVLLVGIAMAVVTCKSCKPIKNFTDASLPKEPGFHRSQEEFVPGYQTVVIIADVQGTEIFDLLAPFNILNRLDQVNVMVLGQNNSSIPLWKGLSIFPHHTLNEFKQIDVKPDLVVVPNILNPEDAEILNWMVSLAPETIFLSVCEGSRLIAETGRFDGQRIATHHSSLKQQKKRYPQMNWTEGFRYVPGDTLISTSGVAAAVEGALAAAAKIRDQTQSRRIAGELQYPHDSICRQMEPKGMGLNDAIHILSKTAFKSNRDLAVYLPDGFDEFRVGAIVDTYNRTFPMSLNTFSKTPQSITSRYGLTVVPTASLDSLENIDEIIVPLTPDELGPAEMSWLQQQADFFQCELYFYDHNTYIFHQLYRRIAAQYGHNYGETVFRLLDYDIQSEL